MENVNLEGVELKLHTPNCELRYKGCTTEASTAYRIHECAFYYACESCNEGMMRTLIKSFHDFKEMYCKKCKKPYNLNGYVEVMNLKEEQ